MIRKLFIIACLLLITAQIASAQFIDVSPDQVKTPLQLNLKRIGSVKSRTTKEIEASRITVGCKTLNRDFAAWDNYKSYWSRLV